jgi:alkanesulfonate monooxygenase
MPAGGNSPSPRRRTFTTSGYGWVSPRTGALGNTSCLVGTAEQVAEAILGYYRLGISSFLIRGFNPVVDTTEFGRELIPRIKAGAIEIDSRRLPLPG